MNPDALIDQLPGASEALKALARRGVVKAYPRRQLLIEEGQSGETLLIILSGRLRAYCSGTNGREITFGTYGPGEYVGEMSLDGGPRSASVEAVERSLCVVVTRQTLERFVAEHPAFSFELLAKVIRRARAATVTARQMALNDVYGRLRLLLETHTEPAPDGTRRATQRLTHQDIAHLIGCSREMVSRILKDLERGGYVTSDAGHLVVLKAPPPRW